MVCYNGTSVRVMGEEEFKDSLEIARIQILTKQKAALYN